MVCVQCFGLRKVPVDPSDPQAIQTTMETVNKLVDAVYQIGNDGRGFTDEDGDGTLVRDQDSNEIVRQNFPTNAIRWPHVHGPETVSFALDGVVWTHSNGGFFSAQDGLDGYALTEMANGHYHAIYFTTREAWDGSAKSKKPEGV